MYFFVKPNARKQKQYLMQIVRDQLAHTEQPLITTSQQKAIHGQTIEELYTNLTDFYINPLKECIAVFNSLLNGRMTKSAISLWRYGITGDNDIIPKEHNPNIQQKYIEQTKIALDRATKHLSNLKKFTVEGNAKDIPIEYHFNTNIGTPIVYNRYNGLLIDSHCAVCGIRIMDLDYIMIGDYQVCGVCLRNNLDELKSFAENTTDEQVNLHKQCKFLKEL